MKLLQQLHPLLGGRDLLQQAHAEDGVHGVFAQLDGHRRDRFRAGRMQHADSLGRFHHVPGMGAGRVIERLVGGEH
ncbi:hypothetical protein D9M68_792210 [compost metagenome]